MWVRRIKIVKEWKAHKRGKNWKKSENIYPGGDRRAKTRRRQRIVIDRGIVASVVAGRRQVVAIMRSHGVRPVLVRRFGIQRVVVVWVVRIIGVIRVESRVETIIIRRRRIVSRTNHSNWSSYCGVGITWLHTAWTDSWSFYVVIRGDCYCSRHW